MKYIVLVYQNLAPVGAKNVFPFTVRPASVSGSWGAKISGRFKPLLLQN